MASKSHLTYSARASQHKQPVVKKPFELAETKKSNVIISADLTNTSDLLNLADQGLGPYIALFKTHIDIVADFSDVTVRGLKAFSQKHNFMIFEDRKFVDIGNTVDVVNASLLAGNGIVEALARTGIAETFEFKNKRGLLLLAERTTKGSLATGSYTQFCIESARKHQDFVIGFVATRALSNVQASNTASDEDFVVFTTGVNRATKGDPLGQQYQTPEAAVGRGADFIISGRGIYAADDPVEAVKLYQKEGWEAYLKQVQEPQVQAQI
ncbi:MAG: hypothetical protein Q9217_005316 [Psora testacea]